MDQTRTNIRSTRRIVAPHDATETDNNDTVPQEANNAATYQVFTRIENTGRIYTDQTGRFPVRSSQGNNYILVAYDYDSNVIITEPLKNRQGTEILRAYTKIIDYLQTRGFKPDHHWLDNETSQAMRHKTSTRTTTHPPTKCSWTCHLHVEESFHRWTAQYQHGFSTTSMGPIN
jgi:hypothetical protein